MNRIVSLVSGVLFAATAFASTAHAAEGWARSGSWLRAGPSSSEPAITRVQRGEVLDVHGCLRRWSWCDVSVGGDRGWFPGSRIALMRDGRRVALPGVAAVIGLGIIGFERDGYRREHYRDRRFDGLRREGHRRDRMAPHRPAPPDHRASPVEMKPRAGVGPRTDARPRIERHSRPAPEMHRPAMQRSIPKTTPPRPHRRPPPATSGN